MVIKSCDQTALALSGTWTGLMSINYHESSLIPSLGTNPVNQEIYILYLGTNVAFQIYKTMWACHTGYSWNNKCQKCAGMGFNGFIIKKINKNNAENMKKILGAV